MQRQRSTQWALLQSSCGNDTETWDSKQISAPGYRCDELYFGKIKKKNCKLLHGAWEGVYNLLELAGFKAESKDLPNQGLTIKRLEAQMGQIKAQLQNQVNCIAFHWRYETRLSIPFDATSTVRQTVTMTFIGDESNAYAIICRMASHASQALPDQEQVTSFLDQT